MIVLDTNVLSELMLPVPEARVASWMNRQVAEECFVTAVTQAEIFAGFAVMPMGRRRERLAWATKAMFDGLFAARILPFDSSAAIEYAKIFATRKAAGRPQSVFDCQIAAIARSRQASVATRNVRDFEGCGVEVVDPWAAG